MITVYTMQDYLNDMKKEAEKKTGILILTNSYA